MKSFATCLIVSFLTMYVPDAFAAGDLSLTDYLGQVKSQNRGFRGSVEQDLGAQGRTREAELITTPALFFNAQYTDDAKLPEVPIETYDKLITQNFSLGLSEQFAFGLKSKLYYALDSFNYVNASVPGASVPSAFFTPIDARPVVELSFPLWGGGFGRTVRATQESQSAQSESDRYLADAQLRSILVQAEANYWQLAAARELVAVQNRALEEAQQTYDYNQKRARMNLVESSDVLQSEAALEAAKLNLKTARDNERSASRAFNLTRNTGAETPTPELSPIDWSGLEAAVVSKERVGMRADVLAAEAQSRSSEANSRIQVEKDLPTLEVYGSYALNGRDYASDSSAISDSFSAGRPTSEIGLRFNMPLNFGAISAARSGAAKQEAGADLTYQQKLADQETEWTDLVDKILDAQEQLRLSRIIEETQRKKLENEKRLLKMGRSTTFQVLQFEQDYTRASLARTQAGAQALALHAQLKLYQPEGGQL